MSSYQVAENNRLSLERRPLLVKALLNSDFVCLISRFWKTIGKRKKKEITDSKIYYGEHQSQAWKSSEWSLILTNQVQNQIQNTNLKRSLVYKIITETLQFCFPKYIFLPQLIFYSLIFYLIVLLSYISEMSSILIFFSSSFFFIFSSFLFPLLLHSLFVSMVYF